MSCAAACSRGSPMLRNPLASMVWRAAKASPLMEKVARKAIASANSLAAAQMATIWVLVSRIGGWSGCDCEALPWGAPGGCDVATSCGWRAVGRSVSGHGCGGFGRICHGGGVRGRGSAAGKAPRGRGGGCMSGGCDGGCVPAAMGNGGSATGMPDGRVKGSSRRRSWCAAPGGRVCSISCGACTQ